jgi:hypothetical protein
MLPLTYILLLTAPKSVFRVWKGKARIFIAGSVLFVHMPSYDITFLYLDEKL